MNTRDRESGVHSSILDGRRSTPTLGLQAAISICVSELASIGSGQLSLDPKGELTQIGEASSQYVQLNLMFNSSETGIDNGNLRARAFELQNNLAFTYLKDFAKKAAWALAANVADIQSVSESVLFTLTRQTLELLDDNHLISHTERLILLDLFVTELHESLLVRIPAATPSNDRRLNDLLPSRLIQLFRKDLFLDHPSSIARTAIYALQPRGIFRLDDEPVANLSLTSEQRRAALSTSHLIDAVLGDLAITNGSDSLFCSDKPDRSGKQRELAYLFSLTAAKPHILPAYLNEFWLTVVEDVAYTALEKANLDEANPPRTIRDLRVIFHKEAASLADRMHTFSVNPYSQVIRFVDHSGEELYSAVLDNVSFDFWENDPRNQHSGMLRVSVRAEMIPQQVGDLERQAQDSIDEVRQRTPATAEVRWDEVEELTKREVGTQLSEQAQAVAAELGNLLANPQCNVEYPNLVMDSTREAYNEYIRTLMHNFTPDQLLTHIVQIVQQLISHRVRIELSPSDSIILAPDSRPLRPAALNSCVRLISHIFTTTNDWEEHRSSYLEAARLLLALAEGKSPYQMVGENSTSTIHQVINSIYRRIYHVSNGSPDHTILRPKLRIQLIIDFLETGRRAESVASR